MKKIRKTVLVLIGIVFAVVLCAGCANSTETLVLTQEEHAEEEITEEKKEEAAEEVSEERKETEKICVFICGAVNQEGVYYLEKGARLYEGIEAAGGFTEEADTGWHNQAAVLEDGSKIQIYTVEETETFRQEGIREEQTQITQKEETDSDSGEDKTVNINKASAEQLQTIPGIGAAKAEAILTYRENNGMFSSVDEIQNVPGIKGKTYEKIQPYITIEEK